MKTDTKKVYVLCGIMVAFCSILPLRAQQEMTEHPQSWTFSLSEAVDYALAHNNSMKNAQYALRESEATKWATIANYLPQANANIGYTNYMGSKLEFSGMKINMDPSSTLTFQATQLLFNANVIVGIQLSELAREMSELAVSRSELSVKQSTQSAYYAVLVSENNKALLEKNVENVRALATATRAKVDVGIGESTEADEMEVTLANLENMLKSTERTIEMAYNAIRLLLGLSAEDNIVLSDHLERLTDNRSVFELLTQDFLLEENIDIQTSRLNVLLSEKQLHAAVAEHLPSVTAVYQHNEILLKTGFDMNMHNIFSLSASIPLFTSGKTRANTKKAKFAYEAAKENHEYAKEQLQIQDKQLRYNLKNAMETYEIQKQNIEVSKRVFENITKKYEQGLASSLEVTNANNNLLTAQSNYVNAVMSMLNAKDELLKLLGTL